MMKKNKTITKFKWKMLWIKWKIKKIHQKNSWLESISIKKNDLFINYLFYKFKFISIKFN